MKTKEQARSLRQNATEAEKRLWRHLRNRQLVGYKFRRQMPIEPYIVDFACLEAKLIIELDGGQHADHQAYDEKRSRFLESCGYRVLRFWNNAILQETTVVLEQIRTVLLDFPHPSPLPEGEGENGGDDAWN